LRRIKRTKITVIRTETIFLKIRDFPADAPELLKLQAAGLEKTEAASVLEIEAIKQETDTEGEEK
jgi:hypothetical protein